MSGPLWLTPGARSVDDALPVIPRPRRPAGPPPADPMEELADRLGTLVAGAVHPDEIAAVLESDGMTDEHIRLAYGRPDSFTLAEDLYEKVPRRFTEPAGAPADPWRVSLTACLLRGFVFALPGLAYVLGAPLLEGPRDRLGLPAGTLTLLAGALIGWVWDQTLSHRAYSWLGLGDRAAAGRTLLVGAPAGALLGTAAALAVPGPAFCVAFAAGQSLYVGAATVLLVMGRERVLLLALSPMALGAPVALAVGMPVPLRVGLLAASLLAACTLAVRELPVAAGVRSLRARLRGRAAARRDRDAVHWRMLRGAEESPVPRGPRLADSVPFGVFGLGTGLLVLYAALGDVLAGGPAEAVAAPSAVALTLSMGPAEWLLHRFRSGSLAGLRAARTTGAFWRATLTTLAECLTCYLGVLLALGVAGTLLWPGSPGLAGVRLVTLLLLGAVMWTGLLLQSFGAVRIAAGVCGAAAVVQSTALLTGAAHPRLVQLVVAAAAAAALAGLVCVLLGRATAHR
ncbi:hypothetical protein [Streptomyces sp. NPDC089919]|uniref:hypothetical protein n=1 Tax=Streptomyces sp. NPDC089919 TaxID=3155188 RepID=UPI0034136E0B